MRRQEKVLEKVALFKKENIFFEKIVCPFHSQKRLKIIFFELLIDILLLCNICIHSTG